MTYPVDGGLDVVSSQERQCVTRVDGETPIQGLSPLPVSRLMVLDLKCSDWLAEKESQCAKVGMPIRP